MSHLDSHLWSTRGGSAPTFMLRRAGSAGASQNAQADSGDSDPLLFTRTAQSNHFDQIAYLEDERVIDHRHAHAPTGDMFTVDIVEQKVGSPYTRSGPLDVFNETLSGTCAAVVLAAQRQARARGLLPNDRELSVAALSSFVKRTAGQQEVTSAGEVLNFAREVGLVRADQAPGGRFQGTPVQWESQHIVFYDYVFLGNPGAPSTPNLAAWRFWLRHFGPIVVQCAPDSAFLEGAADLNHYQGPVGPVGQAVTIEGFDEGGFLFTPNWGPGWGDNGHRRMTDAYAQAACREAWGPLVGRYPGSLAAAG